MRFFQIQVEYFPGEEGNHWVKRNGLICSLCGLRSVRTDKGFTTPDDWLLQPSLYFDDEIVPPIFRVGGIYFVDQKTKQRIKEFYGIQIVFEPVPIENLGVQVYWMKCLGRLEILPLYWFLSSPCSECGHRRQQRITPRPIVPCFRIINGSWTGCGIYRAEETGSPDFVEEAFKLLLEEIIAEFPRVLVTFKEVDIVQEAASNGGPAMPVPT
jgi:hypothetical protein